MAATNATATGCQECSHKALGEFLAHAAKADLPSLSWTISDITGALVGEAGSLTSTPAEQRAAVEAWASYLDAEVTERTDRIGVVHLNAHFKWAKDTFVAGAIRADIFPPFDEDGES